jgi:HEAT repeat protein
MRQHREKRSLLTLLLSALAGWLALSGGVSSAQDPVEELREALVIRQADRSGSPTVLSFRRETLQKRIDALRTISDLRRALVEWREDVDVVGKIRDLDEEMRAKVGRRLKEALEKVARSGDATSRMVVATLLAEMGPTVRGVLSEKEPKTKEEKEQQERDFFGGFARSLTPTVIELTRDRDLDVRRMALRALGTINADPRLAVPVFKKILETPARGAETEDLHRLAAGGLFQMIKVANALPVTKKIVDIFPKRPATRGSGVLTTPEELVETAREVVLGAAAGLRDPDSQVRLVCLDAFQKAGTALGEFPGAIDKKDFPPPGRDLSDEEKKEISFRYNDVQALMDERKPILEALAKQGPALDRALRDENPRVRWAAVTALEQFSHLRLRMRQRSKSLPDLPKVPRPQVDKDFNAMILGRLPAVAALLGSPDSDLQTRTEAIEYVENLEEDAAPAVGAILQRLSDPNRFIRWAATRTVGSLPPEQAVLAVPGLAHLLGDTDLEVRMAAAAVLENLGPLAKDALPALKHGVVYGDADFRVAVIYTLSSLGPRSAAAAVPELIQALAVEQSSDARVRRAAADVLGKIGPPAAAAIPALRQLLGDDDAEVRVKASDAILNIQGQPK